jgi:putative membrane protein insertion efficiency factor
MSPQNNVSENVTESESQKSQWKGRPVPPDADVRDPNLQDLPVTIWNLPRFPFLLLIRLYQLTFSRALPPNTCRFTPTCSHYGFQAIYKHGILKGIPLTIWRIIRCNPFNPGGYDPVK